MITVTITLNVALGEPEKDAALLNLARTTAIKLQKQVGFISENQSLEITARDFASPLQEILLYDDDGQELWTLDTPRPRYYRGIRDLQINVLKPEEDDEEETHSAE